MVTMGVRTFSIAVVTFLVVKASCSPLSSSPSSCSNSTDLQDRISHALDQKTSSPTPHLQRLRGTKDNVLTPEECRFLLDTVSSDKYVSGSGYNAQQYGGETQSQPNLSGLELKQLSNPTTGFATEEQYKRYLSIREKIRLETELALGLCPGTLRIDFTHLSQKTKGGKHTPHADNCFYTRDIDGILRCDPNRKHPFPTRVAASIVYVNDYNSFGGGEFYWANHKTGEPEVLVKPEPGRMAYFSSGIENLHGALPVENIVVGAHDENKDMICSSESDEKENCAEPRRVYLALWYVDDTEPAEIVPRYTNGDDDSGAASAASDPNAPTKVLEIPVVEMRHGGLRVALSFFLLALQNKPSKGTWRFVQQDDVPLGMVFKDETAMFSIGLGDDAIVIERHTDNGKRPSLFYQLQESLALHMVLDELHSLAFGVGDDGQNIVDEDRLLILKNEDAIEQARNKLPVRSS